MYFLSFSKNNSKPVPQKSFVFIVQKVHNIIYHAKLVHILSAVCYEPRISLYGDWLVSPLPRRQYFVLAGNVSQGR